MNDHLPSGATAAYAVIAFLLALICSCGVIVYAISRMGGITF